MPLPSLGSFPPPPAVTALLHLAAHPAMHPEKSDAETGARLDRPGLFLIRTLPDSTTLLLSVRVEKSVADFELTVTEEPAPFALALSSHRFHSLDALIAHAIKVGFSYRGELLRMERCVQREHGDGDAPLGHWEHARLAPRACKQRLGGDGRLPCSLLAPVARLARALTDEELEELVRMKHDALLHLDDYTRLSDAALLLKFTRFEISLGAYLRAHGPRTSVLRRLAWIEKTISALAFLMERGGSSCSSAVLLTGDTLVLQDADSLQLKLVHVGGAEATTDPAAHWRWLAPEAHSSSSSSASPLSPSAAVWQVAVLTWAAFTDFALTPMEGFPSLEAFLAAGAALPPPSAGSGSAGPGCPFLALPHSLTAEQRASQSTKKHQPSYASLARFSPAPANINCLFARSLVFAPAHARATFSQMARTFTAEVRTARLATIVDKLIP